MFFNSPYQKRNLKQQKLEHEFFNISLSAHIIFIYLFISIDVDISCIKPRI